MRNYVYFQVMSRREQKVNIKIDFVSFRLDEIGGQVFNRIFEFKDDPTGNFYRHIAIEKEQFTRSARLAIENKQRLVFMIGGEAGQIDI
ncbi:hypothetical protein DDE05_38030 [Streptomyces cavourensis]|nr:hypothetical protein DDE05_38030 [Streptomyces cavourensis]